ncbi:MAG: hypothetical protein LBT88_06170, partial [Oscillospiraceae bacterium]|nr:hypothetical protein [Oscillospiraceae bacterium]
MKRLPKILPEYTITPVSDPPFECRWEELMGWFIVPKLGEKLNWAIYDHPERVITEVFEMEVIGRAVVHGIEGVEIVSEERNAIDSEHRNADVTRKFVVQLTDTHSRILAEEHPIDGIKHFHTFLDGDAFIGNWGFGEDNCGNEINLRQCGSIHRDGSNVTTENAKVLLDVVGRY